MHTKEEVTRVLISKNWATDLLIPSRKQLEHAHLPFKQEPGKVFVAINTFWVIDFHSRELPANSVWKEGSH